MRCRRGRCDPPAMPVPATGGCISHGVTSPCPVTPGALSATLVYGSAGVRQGRTRAARLITSFSTDPRVAHTTVRPFSGSRCHSTHLYRRRCATRCKKSVRGKYHLARTSSPGNRYPDRSHRTGHATAFSCLMLGVGHFVFSCVVRVVWRSPNPHLRPRTPKNLASPTHAKLVRGHVSFSRWSRVSVATQCGSDDRNRRRDIQLVPG